MHINVGTWNSVSNIPPKLQIIFSRGWKGIGWYRWAGGTGKILRGSLLLGYVELRFWRRPNLYTKVEYPE